MDLAGLNLGWAGRSFPGLGWASLDKAGLDLAGLERDWTGLVWAGLDRINGICWTVTGWAQGAKL